ncbi:MAG: ABC1 family [Lasallia pustulata]|uniref:ABC1 family n=1 Tax=Lasallia pustulata TaxID=136370 RepID=A0A5M8PKZ7_9LECA|nr:MAG: ABC1 family [Lasallia pustulata]
MRPTGFAALRSQAAPWTCGRCLRHRRGASFEAAQNTIRSNRRQYGNYGNNGGRSAVLLAATGGAAGAGALAFTDDVKHGYAAVRRSGRVLSTLALCINDYRVTLNHKTEDEEERTSLLKACHKRCAERTLEVLERNGSIFIKLGQHLSSMNYLLPEEWTTTFIPLQDRCPVSSYESIENMFLKDTGNPITTLFDEFEREPLGSASLAQVHRARLKDTGQEVAVKVQHPALEEWARLDLALTRMTFSVLKRFFPEYDLEWLSNEMEYSLPQELDFALEGRNALRAKEYFKNIDETPLVIPDVKWGLKRILVMEYISGHRPDDLEYLDSNGIDRDEVSAALSRIFNEMIFGDGAPLHCDPHGGNIAIRKNTARRRQNFDIILYDHGLYRDIPKQLRRDYAKLWLAVIDADESAMRKYAYEVAGITDDQFPLFASAITGRDYRVLTKSVVSARSDQEKEDISGALGEGMLQQLVVLLGRVPRIMLLILKTNDLTRSLDENLHTRQGPVRTFMILARYCSRTVFQEQMEILSQRGSIFWPSNLFQLVSAWGSYMRVEVKLSLYEYYISFKRVVGLSATN